MKRSVQLICNVEQELADLLWSEMRANSTSMASYLRSLVIEDLKSRGRLSPDLIEELLK